MKHDADVADCLEVERHPESISEMRAHRPESVTSRTAYGTEDDYESALYARAIDPILRQHAWLEYMEYWKYRYGMLYGGPPPLTNPFQATSDEIDRYLHSVIQSEQPAGLLIYWRSLSKKLCSGLVLPDKRMLIEAAPEPPSVLAKNLVEWDADGLKARAAHSNAGSGSGTRTVHTIAFDNDTKDLVKVAQQLLPGSISERLANGAVHSLLIVPIENIGAEPFAALPVDGAKSPLINFTTITVGPGFLDIPGYVAPSLRHRSWNHALVVGDPDLEHDQGWRFENLPGAQQEASDVTKLFGASAVLLEGPAATHTRVVSAIKNPIGLDLIYIASHAITDEDNPQDGSFIALTGGNLYTREVEKFTLKNRPLVVLSACQTGLGKNFEGGIFGMALAWYRSGASAVVTSLWNVDDDPTHDLMVDFMTRIKTMPPSAALAEAMRSQRLHRPNYRDWAGFAVFGSLPTVTKIESHVPRNSAPPRSSARNALRKLY